MATPIFNTTNNFYDVVRSMHREDYKMVKSMELDHVFEMLDCYRSLSPSWNLSINAQHIVVFKNPRDKSQIRFFAQQVAPGKVSKFLDVFNNCTERRYGYLHCDFSQNTPEEIRFTTNSFPHEHPIIAYKI